MKRNHSRHPHGSATLGDALSPKVKDQLHRLRSTLQEQVRETIASQLAGNRPPWHQQQRSTTGRVSAGKARQQLERPKTTARAKPKPPPMQKFEYWDFPSEATVRELPPASISDADRSRFEETLRTGTDSPTVGGEEIFFILGLDLGTSSTKMIVRLPYEAGEPTIAIPASPPLPQ